MPTKVEFAQSIKAKYPQYASMPDAELADKMLAKYPQYQASITPDSSPEGKGWGPTIARVATPIVGSIAGAPFGPAGVAAGGGGGAMLGETIAQFLEGDGYRPLQIGAQGIIGAIPIPGANEAAPFLRQVAGQAVKGAALGAGATTLSAAAEGHAPALGDVAKSAGIGAVLGGGLHGVLAKRPIPVSEPIAHVAELDAINEARNLAVKPASVGARVKDAGIGLVERLQNRLVRPDLMTKDLMAKVGRKFESGESPFDEARIAIGEGSGKSAQAVFPLREAMQAAEGSGMGAEVKDYLDVMGMQAGLNTLEQRAQKMEAAAKAAGVDANVGADAMTQPPLPRGWTAPLGDRRSPVVPPTTGEANWVDRMKAISEKNYDAADGIRNKVESGQALPENLNAERLRAIHAEKEAVLGPERFAEVKRLAQPVFDFNKETASKLHEYGFISQGRLQELHANEGYIPLLRELDDQVNNIIAHGEPIHIPTAKGLKVLKGSDLVTMDPYEASLVKRQIIEMEGARNRSVNAFTKFAEKDPTFAQFAIPMTGKFAKVPDGYDIIEGFRDGHKMAWAMPEEIAKSLKLLSESNAASLGQTLTKAGAFFQRLATVANAGFSATNPIRDVMDIAILNPHTNILDTPRFLKDWLAIFGENLYHDVRGTRNLERESFLTSGAAYSTSQRNITPKMQLSLRNEGSMIDRLFRPIESLSANTEEASKMAMSRLLARKGVTGNKALINIRDLGGSPDFAVRGSAAAASNSLIPFFNASMQGIARNIKGIKGMSPQRMATLLAGASALELVKDQWNSQFVDKDGVPSIERMSDNDKQNYFTFITANTDASGRHLSVKLSKGHAARILFNPIADVIDMVRHKKGTVAQTAGDTAFQFSPGNVNFKSDHPVKSVVEGAVSSLNPLLKWPIEEGMNLNTFTGAPIEAKRLEGLPPGMRSTKTTNPAFKRMGEQANVSPARIQHTVQTMVPGTMGELSTELLNRGMGESKGSLFGSVTRRFAGSESDQYKLNMEKVFYDELAKTDEVVQGMNKLRKTNPGAVKAYVQQNLQTLQRRTVLTKVASRLGELRNLPDEKANPLELKVLQQAMTLLGQDTKAGAGNSGAKRLTKQELDRLYAIYQEKQ